MNPPRTPRWPVGGVARIAHGTILGLLQPLVPISLFVGLGPFLFDGERLGLVPVVGAVVLALLVCGGLVGLGRVSLADLGLRRDRIWRELLLGAGCLAVYLACFVLIVWARVPDSGSTFQRVASQSFAERALLLLVGLAIAFFEEPVFRGYLQPALIARLGFPGGIAVTALFFAAWHPPHFNLTSFLVRLSLGVVTGLARGRDRPLTAALTAHALLWAVVGLA